jgi:hypothetical protein
VFAELDWVPGNVSQAEDRCHRIGQDSSVLVQHLVVDGSIDARLAEVLVSKQKVLDKALDNVVENNVSIEEIAIDVESVEKVFKKSPKPLPANVVVALQDFVSVVAGVCDGAFEEDGVGFNGTDSNFGKSLAGQDQWTPAQQHAAKTMIKKYKRQIVNAGRGEAYQKIYG